MKSTATTITDFLAEIPEDRRGALTKVRDTILKHLPEGYEEAPHCRRQQLHRDKPRTRAPKPHRRPG